MAPCKASSALAMPPVTQATAEHDETNSVRVDLYVLQSAGIEDLLHPHVENSGSVGDAAQQADNIPRVVFLPSALKKAEHLLSLGTRRATLAGRAALGAAVLLKAVLGVQRSDQLVYGAYGKPQLARGNPKFNLSDAGDVVVLGVCSEELGVDVAPLLPMVSDRALLALGRALGVPHFFGDPPAAELRERASQPHAFAREWARVEAVLKAEGTGFAVAAEEYLPWFQRWKLSYSDYAQYVMCVATASQAQLVVHEFDVAQWLDTQGCL